MMMIGANRDFSELNILGLQGIEVTKKSDPQFIKQA